MSFRDIYELYSFRHLKYQKLLTNAKVKEYTKEFFNTVFDIVGKIHFCNTCDLRQITALND